MDGEKMLSLRDVSRSLPSKPHVNSVRRWILTGSRGRKLPATLIVGRWWVAQADLDIFLKATPGPAGRPPKVQLNTHQLSAKSRVAAIYSS